MKEDQITLEIKGKMTQKTYKIVGDIKQGSVLKGELIDNKTCVAIKLINKHQKGDLQNYRREFGILNMLKSQYIVRLIDYSIIDDQFFLIQELCSSNLKSKIQEDDKKFTEDCMINEPNYKKMKPKEKKLIRMKYRQGRLKELEKEAIDIIAQVLAGYLHLIQERVVHRNLKPENILFSDKTYKISSFSCSRTLQHFKNQQLSSNTGTHQYKSPQQIGKPPNFTSKCDIFSIGLILFELITGFLPLYASSKEQSNEYPFTEEITLTIDPIIKDLIIKCLKYEESIIVIYTGDRIDWLGLYNHQAFANTILSTNVNFTKQIKQLRYYLDPFEQNCQDVSNKLKESQQYIFKAMKQQKRKNLYKIKWPFFYRLVRQLNCTIPPNIASKIFCLIDQNSKGYFTKEEFQNWINQKSYQYTFDDILSNKVLACILTLIHAMKKYGGSLQQYFDIYGFRTNKQIDKNDKLNKKLFQKLLCNIDNSITEQSIGLAFNHLKCNDRISYIEFSKMNEFLKDAEPESVKQKEITEVREDEDDLDQYFQL